jgi:hypothetical protein
MVSNKSQMELFEVASKCSTGVVRYYAPDMRY